MRTIELDANSATLGRLASKIAMILQGKDSPSYNPRSEGDATVKIKGIKGLRVTGNKMDGKIYRWYTGYPGGLQERKYKEMFQKSPQWILRHAVMGMLPKNRLRSRRIKRLIIES